MTARFVSARTLRGILPALSLAILSQVHGVWIVALAFAIFFVIQVPLSLWWLRRFTMGPMEWVWRYLTYGHRPAMVHAGTSARVPST